MIEVNLRKQLGSFKLDVSFAAGEELVVLFGHSGSGKSLSLAAVAGLVRPDEGRIEIAGRPVFDAAQGIDLPPQQRMIGYVPQQLALFPHMTAAENISYGLLGFTRDAREARVAELVGLLGLEGLEGRLPAHLSGGQQQRVALARALAPQPRLLLLDEPFSALDSAIRKPLRRELLELKERLGLTVLFVTHDLREAYNLADRLVVYDGGRTLDHGARDRVYHAPAGRRVAELIEYRNVLPGRVVAGEGGGLNVEVGGTVIRTREFDFQPGDRVDVGIRPEQVLLVRHERGAGVATTHLRGHIVEETAHGASHTLLLETEAGLKLEAEMPAHPYEVLNIAAQKEWWIGLRRESMHVMPADSR
jgi:molybdate transport system ATP-binding protein